MAKFENYKLRRYLRIHDMEKGCIKDSEILKILKIRDIGQFLNFKKLLHAAP